MKIGYIWEAADTDSPDLFDTVPHFRVTSGVLNSGWKIYYQPHQSFFRKWAIEGSPQFIDDMLVGGRWEIA